MPDAPFTEAEVAYLLKARKYIYAVRKDTTDRGNEIPLIEVSYVIRRVDNPTDEELRLKFWARRERPFIVTGPKPRPGVSLRWHGFRIRGIGRSIKKECFKNGLPVGLVRGWYERQWTDTDQDKFCVSIAKEMQHTQEDFFSVVRFCLNRWNVGMKRNEDRQQVLKLGV